MEFAKTVQMYIFFDKQNFTLIKKPFFYNLQKVIENSAIK